MSGLLIAAIAIACLLISVLSLYKLLRSMQDFESPFDPREAEYGKAPPKDHSFWDEEDEM